MMTRPYRQLLKIPQPANYHVVYLRHLFLLQAHTVQSHVQIQIAISVQKGAEKSEDPSLNDGNRNAIVSFAVNFMFKNGMVLAKRQPNSFTLQKLTTQRHCEMRKKRQNG